jgi:uncharacterized protein YdbL (DUF1318 family)
MRRDFIETECLRALTAVGDDIRSAAVLALGHSARRHGYVGATVKAALDRLKTDPQLAGRVADAFDDIATFT